MNLLLVTHEYANQHEILPEVLKQFREINRQNGKAYRAGLVHDWHPNWKHKLWSLGQPTVVVSMEQVMKFKPEWATVWNQVPCDKAWEYEMLGRADLPLPKWVAIREGETPDLSGFSDFVVTKPARSGGGALVRIMRRNRVRWQPSEIRKFKWSSDALIVQEYIHTGPWPTSYRVGSVFGEPVYAWRVMAERSRRPFDSEAKRDSHFFDGRTIVSSSKGCTFDENVPHDVLELAKRVHTAFPTVPILGIDIVREFQTGTLYTIEVNAMGDVFHLTSDTGRKIAREFNLDLMGQFGGASAIARGIYRRLDQHFSHAFNQAAERLVREEDLEEAVRSR